MRLRLEIWNTCDFFVTVERPSHDGMRSGADQAQILLVALQCCLDRLAQHCKVALIPTRDIDVGEQSRRFAERDDPVADTDRLFELMRDQDGGATAFARERQKRLAQFGCRDLVEMTERLV